MAKGSVRKKGKKWYYRFYVEDASGNSVQREFPGSESKSETEAMLRKAMADYEEKQFVAKSENLTLAGLLDKWIEEELKPGSLSNGTVAAYIDTARRIKKHPIADRKLKKITPDHLQSYLDLLSLGGEWPDGTVRKALSSGSMRQYSAVLQGAFRFAVFPKQYLSFNPMQYIVYRKRTEDYDLFSEDGTDEDVPIIPTISYEQFLELNEMLFKKKNPALLPIQIAYYTGLRIGEVCSLTWQDIDLKEQRLTVRRSIRYNSARHRTEIGTTKRKKIRSVDFCNTLAEILKEAKKTQMLDRLACGPLYSQNYYLTIEEKNRTYYEVYSLPVSEHPPEGYQAISLVCVRQDGRYESPATVSNVCQVAKKRVDGMESFHFHQLRHPYVKHTTKIFSLRLMDSQAQAYPDARRKTRGACQLHRGGQNRSSVRPLCNRKRFS